MCVPLQVEEAVRARLTIEKEALLLRAANENYSEQVRVCMWEGGEGMPYCNVRAPWQSGMPVGTVAECPHAGPDGHRNTCMCWCKTALGSAMPWVETVLQVPDTLTART